MKSEHLASDPLHIPLETPGYGAINQVSLQILQIEYHFAVLVIKKM
jgi:hypothetical protein